MNAATKTKVANGLTAVVAIIAAFQTSLTTPPFAPESIKLIAGILAFATVLFTYLKQLLSADVSAFGKNLTLVVLGLPAVLLAATELLSLLDFSETTFHWISWSISMLGMLINITSKILFPSIFQKEKTEELKTIQKFKTQ